MNDLWANISNDPLYIASQITGPEYRAYVSSCAVADPYTAHIDELARVHIQVATAGKVGSQNSHVGT